MVTEPAQVPQSGTQTVTVDTGRERYDIVIGRGLLAQPQTWAGLPRAAQAVVVSNATIAPCGPRAWCRRCSPTTRR